MYKLLLNNGNFIIKWKIELFCLFMEKFKHWNEILYESEVYICFTKLNLHSIELNTTQNFKIKNKATTHSSIQIQFTICIEPIFKNMKKKKYKKIVETCGKRFLLFQCEVNLMTFKSRNECMHKQCFLKFYSKWIFVSLSTLLNVIFFFASILRFFLWFYLRMCKSKLTNF